MQNACAEKTGLRPLCALLCAAGLLCAPLALAQNLSTDILVVGAGGAGMAAAIEAHEGSGGKAKVVILEKLPFVGGTTLLASTAYNAGGSKLRPTILRTTMPKSSSKAFLPVSHVRPVE